MKKLTLAACTFGLLFFASCGGGTDTPEGAAAKWCELNKKAHDAKDDAAKEAARKEMNDFENEIEEKHKGDEAFMKKVEEEAEKCEGESEGGDND
jgi:hypothetical protein